MSSERAQFDQSRLERLLSSLYGTDTRAPVTQRICAVCVDPPAIDGAGVSRIRDGLHETVAASDSAAARVEALQVQFTEGPCIEAVRTFQPCLEPDLASARARQNWPHFSRAALDQGVAATFAFPLIAGGVAIGALDIYSKVPGALDQASVQDAMMLAGLAALAVVRLDEGPEIDGVAATAEPVEPWAYSAVVHQASGMVSAQLGIGVEQALLRLRAAAFATERSVADVAGDVVTRRLRLDSWSVDD